MPKLIENRDLILKTYHNRHKYGLTIANIAEIFEVDPKTINNYVHKDSEFINSKRIKRNSFMDTLSDDIVNHIINDATNNQYFCTTNVIKDIKKTFKIKLTAAQIYSILRKNNITYKKAIIRRKTKYTDDQYKEMIQDRIERVTAADDVIYTDEVHIELGEIKAYGWNESGKEVVFKDNSPSKIFNKRFTVIASISKTKKIGYKIHEKTVDGEKFKSYIKYIDKKTKCKTHFFDNARIHHYRKLNNTCSRLKINRIYGVPYTPHLNIIENFFRSFKTQLRKELTLNRSNIKRTIRKCWNNVSDTVITNTYNHVYKV